MGNKRIDKQIEKYILEYINGYNIFQYNDFCTNPTKEDVDKARSIINFD